MGNESTSRPPFSKWIVSPEMLVALSAVLLSVCGLFVAIYETSLNRRAQRASVWPYVEVGVSITQSGVELRVQNTGVGPARIRASAVTYKGETQSDWSALMHRVFGEEADKVSFTHSLINGRVLPLNSPKIAIFSAKSDGSPVDQETTSRLGQIILKGDLDLTVCFCSVYDECWSSNLLNMLNRGRGVETPNSVQKVKNCNAAKRSGI